MRRWALSLRHRASFCHSICRVLALLLAEHSFSPFLDVRPSWTLDGAVVSLPKGDVTLEQSTLRLVDGVWQCQVSVRGPAEGVPPHRILLRVAPHTLRRWK